MTYEIASPARDASPNLFWSTFWDQQQALGDWRVMPLASSDNPGGLDAREALASAVILSLFTDKRAPEGWRPDVTDRRGWWGDGVAEEGASLRPLGSHLWLLRHEIVSDETINLARVYSIEALNWMLTDRVCARIDVATGAIESPRRGVWIDITLHTRDGSILFAARFERFWQEVR